MTCKTGYPPVNPSQVRDELGNYVGFFINGTDPAVGIVDTSALAGNFVPAVTSSDGTFRICPETAGVIKVMLADGSDFTITAVQVDAYLGDFMPMNIILVYKAGTTATFSVGY